MVESRAAYKKRVKAFAKKHMIGYVLAYARLKKLDKKKQRRARHAEARRRDQRPAESIPESKEGGAEAKFAAELRGQGH